MLLTITGLGKTVLLLVAGTFIAWAVITAIFIPRRDQRFPRDLNLYITLTAVLFVAQMGAVWWVTGTQEVEEAEAAGVTETTGSETTGGETTGATEATETIETAVTETAGGETSQATETAETGPAETGTTEGSTGDAAAGKQVFASAGCVSCHTLADAGSSGTVGPNLDDASPSYDKVVERVTNGQGVMPPFKDQLSEQQIADVAAYVSSVAGS